MPFLSDQSLGTIKNLLEEQRKEIIEQILSEAPDDKPELITDRDTMIVLYSNYKIKGFNQANAQWRGIIQKLK